MGLKVGYFYKLTYRQFNNTLQGYRNKNEALSQERLIIMRKIMFASLLPHLKKGAKETDLMKFEFEKETLKKISSEELLQIENEIEKVKEYYRLQDSKNTD